MTTTDEQIVEETTAARLAGVVTDSLSGVTDLLDAWSNGETGALEKLIDLVYDELRRIASRSFQGENPGHTLQPTALVHEVYLKFKGQRKVSWRSRAEFFGVVARKIREILVDHARRRNTFKRGGDVVKISLDEMIDVGQNPEAELIALDDALKRLETLDERQSRIVEQRIFVGLSVEEIAELEGVSRVTIWRDWKAALLWLRRELDRT